jgi:hypothetical protein
MINVICVVHMPLPIWFVSFFNSEFKFLLMHESNFYVTWFSFGFNVVGRVSHSRTTFDVAATAAYSWILAATAASQPS